MRPNDLWLTPRWLIDALGSFDLDPCAAPEPRPWPTASQHITLPSNGLALPWHGRVWLNPPYGRAWPRWLARLADHGHGTALILARTDTDGFMRMVWQQASAALFLRGRLAFHRSDGRLATRSRGGAHAPAPSVLVAYGDDDADRLAHAPLDGHFVPLAPRVLLFVSQQTSAAGRHWRDVVIEGLRHHHGSATTAQLHAYAAASGKAHRNRHLRPKVRQVLAQLGAVRQPEGQYRLPLP